MSALSCEHLDQYLSHDLSPSEEIDFQSHLEECAHCRHDVEETRQLDALLSKAVQTEATPSTLMKRVDHAISRRGRRWAASIAALFLIGLGLWLYQPEPESKVPAIVLISRPVREKQPEESLSVHVAVESPGGMAVPVPSDDPTITIIWVYPKLNNKTQTVLANQRAE